MRNFVELSALEGGLVGTMIWLLGVPAFFLISTLPPFWAPMSVHGGPFWSSHPWGCRSLGPETKGALASMRSNHKMSMGPFFGLWFLGAGGGGWDTVTSCDQLRCHYFVSCWVSSTCPSPGNNSTQSALFSFLAPTSKWIFMPGSREVVFLHQLFSGPREREFPKDVWVH